MKTHPIPALLLETASALLLPLPAKHRLSLLVWIGLMRHGGRNAKQK